MLAVIWPGVALAADPADWSAVLAEARGQTVYWNAWAGEARINDYIAWVGSEVKTRFGIDLVHVKVNDTAEVVARVLAEKSAGKTEGGAVDLDAGPGRHRAFGVNNGAPIEAHAPGTHPLRGNAARAHAKLGQVSRQPAHQNGQMRRISWVAMAMNSRFSGMPTRRKSRKR